MNKVITVSLGGRAYQIEEGAHEAVKAYLDEAARRLASDPGKAEILSDLELALAEKCERFLTPAKNVVSAEEMGRIIKEMGPVEGSAGEAPKPAEKPAAHGRVRRLYRIKDEAVISGVCSGLAAYVGLDPTIVRLIFALLTLFTGGSWIVVYILLVLLVPPARTEEQKAAAYGEPFTAKEWVQKAKENPAGAECCRFGSGLREAARRLRQERRERRAYMYPNGRFNPVSGLLVFAGMALSLAWVVGLAAIMSGGPVFGWPLPAGLPEWAAVAGWTCLYALAVVPLRLARHGACRGASGDEGPGCFLIVGYTLLNVALWAVLAWAVLHYFPGTRYLLNGASALFSVR